MHAGTVAEAAVRGAIAGTGSGLFALALVLTFRTTGTLNLALGGVASVAAFVLWGLWADGSTPLGIALVVALAVSAGLGVAGHTVLRPLERGSAAVRTVGTLGLLLVLQAAISLIWGRADRLLPLLVHGAAGTGGLRLGWEQVLAAAVAVAAGVAVAAWLRLTPSGIAALAAGEDARAARLLGVRPARLGALVWAIAGALAGMAGVLLSGLTVTNTTEMTFALVTSLAAALVAGFERLGVAVAAAAGVGALAAAGASVPAVAKVPGLVDSLGFLVVLALVVARPRAVADALGRA